MGKSCYGFRMWLINIREKMGLKERVRVIYYWFMLPESLLLWVRCRVKTSEGSKIVSIHALRRLTFVLFPSSQNTRDIKTDIRAGHRTLAVLLGPQHACYLHTLFLLFPYVVVGLQAAITSPYFGIALLTLPFAFNLSVACFEGEHFTLPQKVALLDSSFGILYLLSIYLS